MGTNTAAATSAAAANTGLRPATVFADNYSHRASERLMKGFSGQVIIITGASSGIGRALALELSPQSPRLVLAAHDATRLDATAEACRQRGAEVLVVPTDVTSQSQCAALVEAAVARFERIDALVNNAGRAMWARFDQLEDVSAIEDIMRVNYLGSVYCTYYALPHLKRSRGLIVALASISGLTGAPLLSGYSASKHAIIGFFESLRIELAGSGVGVTIVAPDFVQSEILERATGEQGQPLASSPLDQSTLMTAEDCARRIVRAMAGRRRLVLTSFRSAWARFGKLLAPELVDRIASRAVRG